jgi:hypothetical protein
MKWAANWYVWVLQEPYNYIIYESVSFLFRNQLQRGLSISTNPNRCLHSSVLPIIVSQVSTVSYLIIIVPQFCSSRFLTEALCIFLLSSELQGSQCFLFIQYLMAWLATFWYAACQFRFYKWTYRSSSYQWIVSFILFWTHKSFMHVFYCDTSLWLCCHAY